MVFGKNFQEAKSRLTMLLPNGEAQSKCHRNCSSYCHLIFFNLTFFLELRNCAICLLEAMMSLLSTRLEYNQICFVSNNQKDTEVSQAIQDHIRTWKLNILFWQTSRLKYHLMF